MSDNLSVQGEGSVGEAKVLISNGNQNHSAEEYARATAEMIFPINGMVSGVHEAIHLQLEAAHLMESFFTKAMDEQKAKLAANPLDHSLSHEIHAIALEAAGLVEELVKESFVAHVVSRLGWLEEVVKVIATNLATASHVENLLHEHQG